MGVAWGSLPAASSAAAAQPPSSLDPPELVGLRLPSRRRVLVSRSFLLILGPGNCVGQQWGWGWGAGEGRASGREDARSWDGFVAFRLLETGSTPALRNVFFGSPWGQSVFWG